MTERTKHGLGVAAAAFVLGVAGDALIRATPWGLNVLLWLLVLVAATAILVRWQGVQLLGGGRWLILPALLFAGALAWRDSLTLGIVNLLSVLIALALAASRSRFGRLRIATMLDYALDSLFAGIYAIFGIAFLVFNDIGWQEIPRSGLTRQALAILRGLTIGLPLVACYSWPPTPCFREWPRACSAGFSPMWQLILGWFSCLAGLSPASSALPWWRRRE